MGRHFLENASAMIAREIKIGRNWKEIGKKLAKTVKRAKTSKNLRHREDQKQQEA